jgi:hypothetical protein
MIAVSLSEHEKRVNKTSYQLFYYKVEHNNGKVVGWKSEV